MGLVCGWLLSWCVLRVVRIIVGRFSVVGRLLILVC